MSRWKYVGMSSRAYGHSTEAGSRNVSNLKVE
jgi:hypothetical protein